MVSIEFLEERLNQIRNSVNRLKRMQAMSKDEFLANPDNFAVAEHHLRRALEALFDIGRHIIAKKSYGKPNNYQDVIEILGQNNVISQAFSESLRGMAGYRNRLVHGYAMVSPPEIYDILNNKLDDFAQFCSFIVRYTEKTEESHH